MKKIFCLLAVSILSLTLFAQDEQTDGKFFKKENMFVGGSVNLSFGNLTTVLGASPYVGYSLNKYVDVAAGFNINYISERDYSIPGDKLRQTLYGPGAFVRLFPVKFLFAQAQYEFNLIRDKYIPAPGSGYAPDRYKYDAHSLLIGLGFSNGRHPAYQKSYYYFSVLWDVGQATYSPYKDNFDRAVPIIRAGYNIALFQGRK